MAPWLTPRARGPEMKMELIQPFINAADAVLAQGLQCPTSVGNLSMEEEAYRRKGVAALIWVTGDIEGRIVIDLDPQTAVRVASRFAGAELPESDELVTRNCLRTGQPGDRQRGHIAQRSGIPFPRASSGAAHLRAWPDKSSEDTEALVICFETSLGNVFMNVALRHNRRRMSDHAKMGA